MDTAVRLTDLQQAVVDFDGDRLLVAGGPTTGKTQALVARYLRLAAKHRPSSVLVLCHSRAGAGRFSDAVLPLVAGGFDALPVTTVWGLAHDLVTRHADAPTLLSSVEQQEEVALLVAADGPARWPSAAHLVGRRAFAAEVASAVVDLEASLLPAAEVLARAAAGSDAERARWADLVAFTARYRSALRSRGQLDAAGLVAAAIGFLDRPEVAAVEEGRFTHVLVDDSHLAPAATGPLVTRLARLGARVTLAADPDGVGSPADAWAGLGDPSATWLALGARIGEPPPPVLVTCAHPSVEPEVVAGELQAAATGGLAWSDMAVLTRTAAGARARAIARALARHGIPTAPMPGASLDEPVVRAILDVLAWVGGDTEALDRLVVSPVAGLDPAEARAVRVAAAKGGFPLEAHPRLGALARLRADLVARAATATPADLAFEVWRQALAHLAAPDATGAGDDRSLDAVVSLLDGLRRRADRRPHERLAELLARHEGHDVASDPWRVASVSHGGDVVTVTSIAAAAGQHWPLVVIAGCVEGELPRIHARPRLFDRALLAEASPPDPRERRRRSLADERRLFASACSRATRRLVATAAPEPGVLVSRFVEGWAPTAACLPDAPGASPVNRVPTDSTVSVFPDGSLRLSASQLSTYGDCPLRYGFEYGLRAKGEAGVHAALGGLVHEVLAAFCDPDASSEVPRTRDGLLALGEQLWRDDIARYRPQVEEARRDYFAMLEAWWQAEGGDQRLAPEVLAVERHFEVDAADHRLRGYIDRIDRINGGIRIVDYKTGKREPRPDDVADDMQLAVYHLAASRDPELAALGPVTSLRLLYVRTMHAFDQPVTEGHEAATEARIEATAARILAEELEPSVDADCRLCSFHRLCPLQDEGRQTGGEAP
ncbi:MAG: PD-(D/E)XK nuclease family protein [Acidimicrobiales bacterium]